MKRNFFTKLLNQLDIGPRPAWQGEIENLLTDYDCLPANPRKIKALVNHLAWMMRKIDPDSMLPGPRLFGPGGTLPEPRHPVPAGLLLSVGICYCFHRSLYEQLEKNPAYVNELINYAAGSYSQQDADENQRFRPMLGLRLSRDQDGDLPVNPSDSNVFRLHALFQDLITVQADEIKPFLGL